MKIAISSLNGQIVTGQPGRCPKFIVFTVENRKIMSEKIIELTEDQLLSVAEQDQPHPLDGVSVLIASGVGEGFVAKMAKREIKALATSLTGPRIAAQCYLSDTLPLKAARKSKSK
ncbi:NifB/NifX family molybdenum-iron cluster-binding protein [Pelagibaculum spongiae]|uniref:NifB/NifX family molybdenum-iron cluster-binding protein n=1 Tax=Pelagibaculum spongiae TaxID=2080658 RepID=UPI001314B395|nr:NifB/NifX family molybdenum-iron cluster-binding protein [Pelagibaculum spongiae]